MRYPKTTKRNKDVALETDVEQSILQFRFPDCVLVRQILVEAGLLVYSSRRRTRLTRRGAMLFARAWRCGGTA